MRVFFAMVFIHRGSMYLKATPIRGEVFHKREKYPLSRKTEGGLKEALADGNPYEKGI
jgi:hypothetical protein